jgi:hypothetical protein
MTEPITFIVYGKPQQRGSKQVGVRYDRSGQPVTKNGRVLTFANDSNVKSKEWMSLVRDKAIDAMRGLAMFDCPVVLTARFYFMRPANHFGTGRNAGVLKASAPREFSQAPDLSKLLRCIEDGLSELVYRDDRQICRYGITTGKYWTSDKPRVEVALEAATTESEIGLLSRMESAS